MSKIRPLNRDSLSDEETPVLRKELQEEIALEIYNKALRLQAKKEFEEARILLTKLINENIPQLENQGGLPKSMSTLKYSCYLNIGHIYLAENQTINSLDNYLMASELDDTDVTLWYKIGKLALRENRFRQSIYAFSKGLDCNESHWPCLDEIISLLFAVRDRIGCLYYIGKALMLDANYTKGLVFRKQIYKDNPASKEYYFQINPDHIWEPPWEVEVNDKDEVKYLKEVQQIIDKINEAEKALESKPLATIPLPKALESYSWMAVSKTVISLYHYIQTNEMSFFTFVDTNKCMSQVVEEEMIECKPQEQNALEACPIITKTENQETCNAEEKMELDNITERRPSQNSEENGTPIQTDIDEEQQTEQDTEEQDEKSGKPRSRGYKRKRDLLLDLRVWGWHSKRKNVRKTKPEKFYTVEDCLNQILPSHLLQNKVGDAFTQEDSMNTMDMYNMFLEDVQVNILSPIHSPKSLNFEPYFGTDKEKEDIIRSWSRPREYCDTCVLLKEFVSEISKLWHIKWPKELISQYIIAYEMYRELYELPSIYNPENSFEDVRNETLITLLYAELVLFSCPKNMETGRMLHIGQIQFLESIIPYWEERWEDEYISVFSRMLWLRAYIFRKETSNESAVRCLQLIEEIILEEQSKSQEKFYLVLPNCNKCGLISTDVTKKILKHLDIIKSISCLEELYNQEKYKEVAEIVKSTFASDSGCPTFGKIGRPAQLGMLLHSLWFTDFTECFIWSEESLFEAHTQYTKPGPDRCKWEKVVEKCLAILHEIIKHKSRDIVDSLTDKKKARLTETLAKIICKQINIDSTTKIPLDTVVPWILLHHLLAKDEEKQMKEKNSNDVKLEEEHNEDIIPASLSILFSAHEFLGPKSWCLTNQGELLHFILDVLLDKDDTYKYEKLREKLDIQIEQALFCLFEHPSKKNKSSRHLADHNVDPLPLTWEKSFQLYEFYAPEVLPEFNSFKNASITPDLEQLLLRITALVVPECDPSVSIQKINEYLQGKTEKIPDPIEFPNRIRAIYYLLGDYYFKIRDFVRCVKYFLMDIAINPQRVGSWACLALSFSSQLEIKLNFCKKIKNEDFLEKAKCAQVSFKTALKLAPDNITLWIECGNFEYIAHSFCSRYLKFESENMSMERFAYLENQKNWFLDNSGQSFEKAITLYEVNDNETDERWLQYYFLGKIAEKRHAEPSEYLNYYLTASQLLHENDATYPDKIPYNCPKHLAVEALELHYRVNASILKYLELHEGKEIHNTLGNLFKKTLDALAINRQLAAQRAQKKLEKSKQMKVNYSVEKNIESKKNENEEITPQNLSNANAENGSEVDIDVTEKVENVGAIDNCPISISPEIISNCVEREIVDEVVLEHENIELDPEMEREIKESINNILEKVEEMDFEPCKPNSPVVQVVDEVILLDADYDVIMILSSDEDDEDNSQNPTKEDSNTQEISALSSKKDDQCDTEARSNSKASDNIDCYESDNVAEDGEQGDEITLKAEDEVPKVEQINQSSINNDTKMNPETAEDHNSSGIYVQQVLDKMMQETMQIASEQQIELDSDTSIVDKSIEVLDCSITEQKKGNEQDADENDKIADKEGNVEKCETDDNRKSTEESSSTSSSGSSDSSSSSDSDSDDDSSVSSSSSSSDDSTNENLSNSEIFHLVDRCVRGLEQCAIRLSKNYKAIYRLVHIYFNYESKKDMNKCKQLLLGEYKCYEGSLVIGLFSDRKPSNFFNGIWRIPSDEIDRSGSLAAHMSRCISILLQILRMTNDCKILLELFLQLRKSPDPDKIYIKDSERKQFSEQALSLCIQSFRNSIQSAEKMNTPALRKLIHDIYKAFVTVQKHASEKESSMGQILVDAYRIFIKEKIPDHINVLDLAIKFCQQMKIIEKQKSIQAAHTPTLHNPLVPVGPVLPTPSNVNLAGTTMIKRPHGASGRPRGRPPLPKVPGQIKPSRGKSPSNSISKRTSWKKYTSEQAATQEYLKHYQEELLKQYNQNLNYMQMAQLAQMYQNPTAFASAYLQAQQTNILNTNILNQFSGTAIQKTLTDKSNSSQMDALQNKFNEMMALVKKGPALGSFSIDQLMASNSAKNISSSKKSNPTSSSFSMKSSDGQHIEPKIVQEKLYSDSEHVANPPTIATELSKKSSNTQSKSKVQTTKSVIISGSQSIHHVPKEIKDPSVSCISSISVIPKTKTCSSKPERLDDLPSGSSKISSIKSDVSLIPKRLDTIGTHQTDFRSIEANLKKMPVPGIIIPSPPVSSPCLPSHSSIISHSPSPVMPPPNSPLSIPSSSPSSISPNTKLPSPQKNPSPVTIKETPNIIPKPNIEAMISRVSPTQLEGHKKFAKDRKTPPVNPHLPNFALEAGLPKLPSSLSMTPVNLPIKTIGEPHQSVTLHKLPSKTIDSTLSKLPSGITVTPSLPKTETTNKYTSSETYSKSYTDNPMAKGGSQLPPTAPKIHAVSSSMSNRHTYGRQNFHKNPSIVDTQSGTLLQSEYLKPSKNLTVPATRASSLTSFNIESMLQSSATPRNFPPVNITYSYSQTPIQKIAHTSVITSTKTSSAGHQMPMNKNVSVFPRPSPMNMDGRNTSISVNSDVKNLIFTSTTSKSKDGPRASSCDFYQVDERHKYDPQLDKVYSTGRYDKSVSITKTATTHVKTTPVMNFTQPRVQTSPCKTLQEKLADKKREQANKQLYQQIEQSKSQSLPKKDTSPNFNNPHSISKMLSFPNRKEVKPKKEVRPVPPPPAPRKRSPSEDSVIFIE